MAELSDLRLFYGTDRRVGSPLVAQRLLAFKRVANEQTRSALYLTGQPKAAAERLQAFAASHGVTLWREPRLRRRPKVSAEVDARLINRFVKAFGLREGEGLSAQSLLERGAVLLAERLDADGGRTMKLAASGASWSVRTRGPVEEATARVALEWHDDGGSDEREETEARLGERSASIVASLTREWGEPDKVDPNGVTRWVFPRTTVDVRLEVSDLFVALRVDVRARVKRSLKRSAAPKGSRRPRGSRA
jgi:hypothetical protein